MTVTRSSLPMRTNAFGIKVLPDDSAAMALTPGKRKPINKPPLAATEAFRKLRRPVSAIIWLVFIVGRVTVLRIIVLRIIVHLLSQPFRQPGESLCEFADTFHSGRYCRSWPRQCLPPWAQVSRAAVPPRSLAVQIGSSRIAARLLPATHVAADGLDQAIAPRWLLSICLPPATPARHRNAPPHH